MAEYFDRSHIIDHNQQIAANKLTKRSEPLIWNQSEFDNFQCGFFSRYTQAATYPKDMLVLFDASGSMTGLRKSIAIHAVSTLLGTLSDNDFFNVLTVRFCVGPRSIEIKHNRLRPRSIDWISQSGFLNVACRSCIDFGIFLLATMLWANTCYGPSRLCGNSYHRLPTL